MDAAELVKNAFPNQAFASFEAACNFIETAYQTGRWQFRLGKFPLATVKIGKKRVVPLPALVAFVQQKFAEAGFVEADKNQPDGARAATAAEPIPTFIAPTAPPKRRPGRPPKIQHDQAGGAA